MKHNILMHLSCTYSAIAKLLYICASVLLCSVIIFSTSKAEQEYKKVEQILEDYYEIRILDTISNALINPRSLGVNSGYKDKDYETLLSKRPCDPDELKSYYVKHILAILAKPGNLDLVASHIITSHQNTHNRYKLLETEKMALLVLCLEQYAANNKTTLKLDYYYEREDISNGFYDEHVSIGSPYEIYKINDTDSLFVWHVSSGAKNDQCTIWTLSIKDQKFKATQLAIPFYCEKKYELIDIYSRNIQTSSYDPESAILTTESNAGTAWPGAGLIVKYKVQGGKLILKESQLTQHY